MAKKAYVHGRENETEGQENEESQDVSQETKEISDEIKSEILKNADEPAPDPPKVYANAPVAEVKDSDSITLSKTELSRLIAKTVADQLSLNNLAAAGDTEAGERLANVVDVYDAADVLDTPVSFYSHSRLLLKDYRKSNRVVKHPFNDSVFFRVLDSQILGPPNDQREHVVYGVTTESKKELEFLKEHPLFNREFWLNSEEATGIAPDDIMWHTQAWKILDGMSDATIIAEANRLKEAGFKVYVKKDLQQTRRMMLPNIVTRLKDQRKKDQIIAMNNNLESAGRKERVLAFVNE